MSRAGNSLNSKQKQGQIPDSEDAKSLIAELGGKNRAEREKARQYIVEIGEAAVPQLVAALSNPNKQVRWEAGKLLEEIGVTWSKHADKKTINALISELGSQDGLVRVRARMALTAIGEKAVPALAEALTSKEDWKRWEAAKAIGQIGDPKSINVLITALDDEAFDVRYVAAEALISIGEQALEPLLVRLTKHPDSTWLMEGAHRILHGIHDNELSLITRPVIRAMEGIEPQMEVPFAVVASLKSLQNLLKLEKAD